MTAQRFKNRHGDDIDLKAEKIEAFGAQLRGALVRPGDGAYDEVRTVYNAMHDRRPALIVQAHDAADVIAPMIPAPMMIAS